MTPFTVLLIVGISIMIFDPKHNDLGVAMLAAAFLVGICN